jgi:hypothetical protein
MAEKCWLTKDERRLLAPHAERYSDMFAHIQEVDTDELQKLLNACLSCTTNNCWWAEYAAAQYLIKEIRHELGWRERRDTEAAELIEPIAHREARWADDGGAIGPM